MKRKINSAELVKYNANARGNNVGDCVKRSMSLAFGMTYNEISKLLIAKMKQVRADAWNQDRVWTKVMDDLGAKPVKVDWRTTTVDEFCDEKADPSKTYVLLCGSPKSTRSTHMVCVKNATIFDSWDCRDWVVYDYYIVPDKYNTKELTDIKDKLPSLCETYAAPIIENQVVSYFHKKGWPGDFDYKARPRGYAVKFYCTVLISPYGPLKKAREYNFEISLVFTPTMTEQDAIDYIKTTAKTRAYDRMYAIAGQEAKLAEVEEAKARYSEEGLRDLDKAFLSNQERKFLNSLPGWAIPLVTYVNIFKPGEYYDSYEIKIHPLPDDDRRHWTQKIYFHGYQASDIRDQLDIYKSTYDVPGEDYDYEY